MSNKKGTFNKSSKTPRTPPKNPNNSSFLDANMSSCQTCDAKDTIDMVKCDKCHKWNHFECVGVTADVAQVSWQCRACDELETNSTRKDETRSTRSSTSSKRRANLALEKLAREKAIEERLTEEQNKLFEERGKAIAERAKADREFVLKEFQIRENMTDSEEEDHDDVVVIRDEVQARNELVSDWLADPNSASVSAQINNQLLQNQLKQILAHPIKIPQFQLPVPPRKFKNGPTIQDLTSSVTKSSCDQALQDITQPNQQTSVTTTATMGILDHLESTSSLTSVNPISSVTYNGLSGKGLISVAENSEYQGNSAWLDPRTTILAIQPSNNQNFQPTPTIQDLFEPPSSIQHSFQQISTNENIFQQSPIIPSSLQEPISQSSIQQSPIYQNAFRSPTVNIQGSTQPVNIQGSTQPVNIQGSIRQPLYTQSSTQQPVITQCSIHQPSITQNSVQQPQIIRTSAQRIPNGQNPYQQINQGSVQQPPIVVQQQPINQGFGYQPPNQSFIYQPPITQGTSQQSQIPTYQHQIPFVPSSQNYSLNRQQQVMPNRNQIAARQATSRDLPKFKGEPEKWSIFYNAFDTSTQICGLTNAENLTRLEKCLEDPARKAVRNLLTQPESVPDIIETLRMLYGRPEVILDALIKQLKNEPAPRMDKMETFIDFAMSVRNVNSEIQNLGMWQHLWNPQLIQELTDKLPYEMRISWGERKLLSPNTNLSHFSDWLFQKARSACAVTLPKSTTNRQDKKREERQPVNNSAFFNAHLNSPESELAILDFKKPEAKPSPMRT